MAYVHISDHTANKPELFTAKKLSNMPVLLLYSNNYPTQGYTIGMQLALKITLL